MDGFSLALLVALVAAALVIGLVATPLVRGRHLRAQAARGAALAERIGLRPVDRGAADFRAEGVVEGVPVALFLDVYRDVNWSSSTDRVCLRAKGTSPRGLVTIAAHGLPEGRELHSHPGLSPRTVATLPGEGTVAWLRPEVVAAIAALPSCARVEAYDQTLEVQFLDGPALPPVDLALRMLLGALRA